MTFAIRRFCSAVVRWWRQLWGPRIEALAPEYGIIRAFCAGWLACSPNQRGQYVVTHFAPGSPVPAAFRSYGGVIKGFRVVAKAEWSDAQWTELSKGFVTEVAPIPTVDAVAGAVIQIGTVVGVMPAGAAMWDVPTDVQVDRPATNQP